MFLERDTVLFPTKNVIHFTEDGTRFSVSSGKARSFRLSRHDKKAESPHWVPFSVFFGTDFLLRA